VIHGIISQNQPTFIIFFYKQKIKLGNNRNNKPKRHEQQKQCKSIAHEDTRH
jgi:hypothetical protein